MLEIRRVAYDHPDAQALNERVQLFYAERYGGSGDEDPMDPAMFRVPDGAYFVGYLDGVPVASGGWRREDAPRLGGSRAAEIKRMYVVPTATRRGFARRMLAHLEETARAAGFDVMLLSTGSRQPEAIALYESSGYEPVEGFGHYGGMPLNRCYAKLLRQA